MDIEDPGAVLLSHLDTGEPLTRPEVAAICATGYARPEDFANVGGGLYSALPVPITEEGW